MMMKGRRAAESDDDGQIRLAIAVFLFTAVLMTGICIGGM